MNDTTIRKRKILIMGLDNSGKTSIILSLKKNTNLLSYYSLKPTHGVEIINIQNQKDYYSIWDFGGQEEYRKEYLNNLEKYILKSDKIIFVIDIQDIDRYELALDYISKIIDFLKNNDLNVRLSVFLHKFDPNLDKKDQYSDEMIKSRLINKIREIIPSNFNYDIFKTTIYTVFQKTLA